MLARAGAAGDGDRAGLVDVLSGGGRADDVALEVVVEEVVGGDDPYKDDDDLFSVRANA